MRPFDFAALWKPQLHPLEVIVRATILYLFVQAVFRLSGRKAMARWGIPEVALLFLVAVATRMGIVGDDPSLTSAMIALVTIVVLDRILTTAVARWRGAAELLEGPVLRLVRDGVVDRRAMRRAHLSDEELLARVREHGRERLDEVKDAFFERSGMVTLVFRDATRDDGRAGGGHARSPGGDR